MTMKDYRGAWISGANQQALDTFETALRELNCYINDPVASVSAAIEAAPKFAMAHALKAYLFLAGTEKSLIPEALKCLADMRSCPLNERERRHAEVIQLLTQGEFHRASERLDDILIDEPRDILALQIGHLFDFFRGDSRNLRDRVQRVLPEWSSDDPAYPTVLGMLAFGLEESGNYAKAEATGREAVDLDHRDSWAHHAVAHVYEMVGKPAEGAKWLTEGQAGWSVDCFFSVHNWWHLALFRLEADDYEGVLSLYDGPIRGGQSNIILEMIDAAAMLWRLKLRGVDVGNRWNAIADLWEPLVEDRFYAFNDAHAMMALLGAGRRASADRLLGIMKETATAATPNGAMTREVGLPLCQALHAIVDGRYRETTEILRPLRYIAQRFGGSHAQRDLIDLTLMEAARLGGQGDLLRLLANERLALKPSSPLAQRYRAQALPAQAA